MKKIIKTMNNLYSFEGTFSQLAKTLVITIKKLVTTPRGEGYWKTCEVVTDSEEIYSSLRDLIAEFETDEKDEYVSQWGKDD